MTEDTTKARTEGRAVRTFKGLGKKADKTVALVGVIVGSLNETYGLGISREVVISGVILAFMWGETLKNYLFEEESRNASNG